MKTYPHNKDYKICRDGGIWSFPRKGTRGGWLSPTTNTKGDQVVSISINGKRVTKKVHVMVLETYKSDRPDGVERGER